MKELIIYECVRIRMCFLLIEVEPVGCSRCVLFLRVGEHAGARDIVWLVYCLICLDA